MCSCTWSSLCSLPGWLLLKLLLTHLVVLAVLQAPKGFDPSLEAAAAQQVGHQPGLA
jgi:hypothetical protein